MPRSDNGRIDLSLFGEFNDYDLLAIVDDLADEDGWARTIDVRIQIGEKLEKGYRSGVGPKLSWFARYGWVERNVLTAKKPGNERQWRLTAVGHAMLDHPELTTAFKRTFASLNPAQRLALTRELAEAADAGATEFRTALRRQWTRSLGR
jgi:hypothetical protein